MASHGQVVNNKFEGFRDMVLFIKDLRNPNNRKRKLVAKSYSSVKDIKDILAGHLQVPVAMQRLFYRGRELRNNRTLFDCGIDSSFQTIFFAIQRESSQFTWSLAPYDSLEPPKNLSRTINQVKRALEKGLAPVLSIEGTGGTYFMMDVCKRKLAAFKPRDEEPFMPNNPRGFVGLGVPEVSMRPGIEPGEACIREVAAYLCDKSHFHGVPATTLVESRHPSFCYNNGHEKIKLGSFQEFVNHSEVVADISPSMLGVKQVHKIALLDIRLLNGDRNDANILVDRRSSSFNSPHKYFEGRSSGQSNEIALVPIDHGYCLPDIVEIGWCDWCWLDWPQTKKPLDKDSYKFVMSLDPEGDAIRLGEMLSLREPCLNNFRVAEMLLKSGTEAGLTLYDIANIIVRHDLDEISALEKIMKRAKELARTAVDSSNATKMKQLENDDANQCPLKKNPFARKNAFNYADFEEWEDQVGLSLDGEESCLENMQSSSERGTSEEEKSSNEFEVKRRADSSSDSSCDSPLGFWQEDMEEVDRRNSIRPILPWSDALVETEKWGLSTVPESEIAEPFDFKNETKTSIDKLQKDSEASSYKGENVGGVLLKGSKMGRSNSYHGLRSEALYDSPVRYRGSKYSIVSKKNGDNSELFKEHYFRLIGMLIQETIKRIQRQKTFEGS
mmetsp:Transcript_12395/g.18589  ORF Transcript_12395/g.18589 Transcript_12395/m.18589 type:complete len:670 (-) Transcript_12395:137-2146(-)